MPAVRIESAAFSDPRIGLLGRQMGAPAGHEQALGIGIMSIIWSYCTQVGATRLSGGLLDHMLARENGARVLAECGLAKDETKDGWYISGTVGRIEWLQKRQKASKKGGLATQAKTRAKTKPVLDSNVGPRLDPTTTTTTTTKQNTCRVSPDADPSVTQVVQTCVGYLNERMGSRYRPTGAVRRLIQARLREGMSEADLVLVARGRIYRWRDSDKMRQYLRPSTIWGPKAAEYLAEAEADQADHKQQQRAASRDEYQSMLGGKQHG